MFTLPRGIGSDVNVPLSSASWEDSAATSRLIHRDRAAIFIGGLPHGDMWETLDTLRKKSLTILRETEESPLPPGKRAAIVLALEEMWFEAQRAEILPLGYKDDRHFVTVAGARSGKGRSAIIPNLCIYPGSVVVVDPKGENASLTAVRRGSGSNACVGMGQDVYVLDPFGVADIPDELRAGFNPLSLIDLKSDTVVDDAALLAEALIVPSGTEGVHWDESAKNLLKGLFLYSVAKYKTPTIFQVRELLTRGEYRKWKAACKRDENLKTECPNAFFYLLDQMRATKTGNSTLDIVISGVADTLEQCGEEERGSILSNARRNTAFLDSLGSRYRETLTGGARPFNPITLKTAANGVSLYLCLPAARITTHNRWLRVVINMTLERLQRDLAPPAANAPVLFVLDEFFTLGPISTIENAAGFAAGYGIKLWLILQDLQQLKSIYAKTWQTFLANAGGIQVFGASDAETCEYVSKMMGEVATRQTVSSSNTSIQLGYGHRSELDKVSPVVASLGSKNLLGAALQSFSASVMNDKSDSGSESAQSSSTEQINIVPLLRPDEVAQQFSRESGAALLLIKGRRPIWTLRVNYDSSPWFAGKFIPLRTRDERAQDVKAIPYGDREKGALERIVSVFNERFKALRTG